MSWDDGLPGELLTAQVGIFGCPWHGVVQGGSLNLPGVGTKTYPQPSTLFADEAGTAHLVQRPGQPEVSRTTEELAADAAAGRQWRNKAMLSGSRLQLHGQHLDGWIYIDSSGDRWLVKFDPPLGEGYTFSTPGLSLTLRFQKFGVFGETAGSITRTVSLTDYGQSFAAFDGFLVDVGVRESITTGSLSIDGIYSDGSKVALALGRIRSNDDPSDDTLDVFYRYPLGWLQVAISGAGSDPTVTLSVLKDRSEVLETVAQSVTDGRSTAVYTKLDPSGPDLSITAGSYAIELELLRLVAAWPDEAGGGWDFVAVRFRIESTTSASVGSAGLTYTVSRDDSFLCYLALEVDGVEKDRLQVSRVIESGQTITYTPSEAPTTTFRVQNLASTNELVFNGDTYSAPGPPGDPVDGTGTSTVSLTYTFPIGEAFGTANAATRNTLAYTMTWRRDLDFLLGSALPGFAFIRADLCRYSNKVFGFRYEIRSAVETPTDFVYRPRVTPSAVEGDDIVRTYSASERLYASWCPHTLALAGPSETPLCWV